MEELQNHSAGQQVQPSWNTPEARCFVSGGSAEVPQQDAPSELLATPVNQLFCM